MIEVDLLSGEQRRFKTQFVAKGKGVTTIFDLDSEEVQVMMNIDIVSATRMSVNPKTGQSTLLVFAASRDKSQANGLNKHKISMTSV